MSYILWKRTELNFPKQTKLSRKVILFYIPPYTPAYDSQVSLTSDLTEDSWILTPASPSSLSGCNMSGSLWKSPLSGEKTEWELKRQRSSEYCYENSFDFTDIGTPLGLWCLEGLFVKLLMKMCITSPNISITWGSPIHIHSARSRHQPKIKQSCYCKNRQVTHVQNYCCKQG